MAKHNVKVTPPAREIGKVDIIFDIYRDGEKLGQIDISKGDLQYYPNKRKKRIKIDWSKFDEMMSIDTTLFKVIYRLFDFV